MLNFDYELNQIINFLLETLLFDYQVFSSGWLYYPLLIPFFIYLIIFLFKWTILTAPIWIPIKIIISGIKGIDIREKYSNKDKEENDVFGNKKILNENREN